MRTGPSTKSNNSRVVVLTSDVELESLARATFGASSAIDLITVRGHLSDTGDKLDFVGATVVVVDVDAGRAGEMAALARLMTRIGPSPAVVAVIQAFDEMVVRSLMQMRIADFLIKPVAAIDLVRACARVAKGPEHRSEPKDAKIYTFLPAIGGAGVTMLAVQTAILLLNSGSPRMKPTTCLVDLNFQHGAVADYLDLEPRLNLAEIEPRPDRLDRQLLEVMLSYHASGLAVVAAPNRPAEMRTFDPDVVTRLLNLVSANFDYVVFDMPRTWFSWTDSVLLGSNKLYIVSEATVPGLRQAKQLVAAIRERLNEGPNPQVIVNRFQQRILSSSLRFDDVRQALGDAFASAIPNDYALVREAIDRGVPLDEVKPGNKVTAELKKLVVEVSASKVAAGRPAAIMKMLKLSTAS